MAEPSITMTLLVRDEEDIIADTIRFHHGLGVDRFIVMDNLSRDATPQILAALAAEIPITLLHQAQDTYAQGEWVTQMARQAAAEGADWVINGDADEFWLPAQGNLKDWLAAVPDEVAVVDVTRHNAVLLRGKDPLASSTDPRVSALFETQSRSAIDKPLPAKCLHRAGAAVVVRQGNHGVSGLKGRSMAAGAALRILHFPYRRLGHYRRKVTLGGAAYERNRDPALPALAGATWRAHYQQIDSGVVEAFWSGMTLSPQQARVAQLSGQLFSEPRLAAVLSGAPAQAAALALAHRQLCERTAAVVREFSEQSVAPLLQLPPEDWPRYPLYYNLEFCIRGAQQHQRAITSLPLQAGAAALAQQFPALRDAFSLFPRNAALPQFLAALLAQTRPEDVARLRQDCAGRRVILHTSCLPRLAQARASQRSFAALPELQHILLVGDPAARPEAEMALEFSYRDGLLTVPAPDNYEGLHRKLFYAFMLLDLLASPAVLVKIDDNLHLGDAAAFSAVLDRLQHSGAAYAGWPVGAVAHSRQWHGWHLEKCDDPLIERRGYQYPLPQRYAAGGYGYVLGPQGLAACSTMYLSMKEFFSMRAIGLEDAFVGHAAQAEKLALVDIFDPERRLAMPGLINADAIG